MSRVDEQLPAARRRLDRVAPDAAAALVAAGALLVDIRPAAQRTRFGSVPGAVVIERNDLEWRLDPPSPHRHAEVTDDPGRPVVLFCQEGYASSLAAAALVDLGLTRTTDLDGGFAAWRRAGLPATEPG